VSVRAGEDQTAIPGRGAGAIWGTSSAAAKIYSNDALFGPIPVGFRVVQPLIAEYGVLQRISSSKENLVDQLP
jgi:hypothetical protein